MSMNEERRRRFELLLQQAELSDTVIQSVFADAWIEQVVTSRTNKRWEFYIVKDKLVPRDVYATMTAAVARRFASIAETRFCFRYPQTVGDAELVEEYWPLAVEWILSQSASINGWLKSARAEGRPGTVQLTLLDQIGLEMAKKRELDVWVQRYFERCFDRKYAVKLAVHDSPAEEYEKFSQMIREEGRSVAIELMTAVEKEEQLPASNADERLMIGYDIRDEPVPMQTILEEEKKTTIQGVIFNLEQKELRTGSTLFTFNLTDFTDSFALKMFAKTKEDLRAMSLLANGKWVKARGRIEYDRFMNPPELIMMPTDVNEVPKPPERMDTAEEKRVEFHLHTAMSAMDGINPIDDYIKLAAKWGHKAIAITDHAVVQSYPEANKAAKKHGMKVIYGVEANVVNDAVPIVFQSRDLPLSEGEYVVFDIETTGLSVINNKIIELAGVKMKDGKVIDEFAKFVDPHEKIPYHITQLTNITDDMVRGAPELSEVLPEFIRFVGDAVLVAHNAKFDMGFIQEFCKRLGLGVRENSVLDTLEMARMLYPTMKNHRLNTLADKFKVSLENHHRAIDDSKALGEVLFHMIKDAAERGIDNLARLNEFVGRDLTNTRPFHCCIYAQNQIGKKNLFKLISLSHTEYFHRVPSIPKSKLAELRDGLIIASGCEKGEFFETILNKSVEEAEQVAEFYDVLEIQPVEINMHLVEKGLVASRHELEEATRRVIEIGRKQNKWVIATGNVHYLHPRDKISRDITIHGITGFSPLKDMKKPDVHFRTTQEMLEAFAFLGEETAREVVVASTNRLADSFEPFDVFPKQAFFPIIEGADEEIREKCYARCRELYGDPLPEVITQRLERELVPIIKAGFSALYLISERLVKKSNADGYLVGSRGSVGSSIVAMALGISEVNPLPPHYLCRSCMHSEWFLDGSVPSGFDLTNRDCPQCGAKMKGDGQDIPFETFLGFKGDKVPDIDLNFSGEYQAEAHNYTKVLFGDRNVFRAGTIGTVAEKTAFGFVKKYEEEHGKKWRGAELTRLAQGCTGVKRSTGQHPGGIVVVPDYIEVEDVTPVQYPADDTKADWKTTHFDYHAFDENLLKLDILGHDDPTMMRLLQDLTGVDPLTIPMNDPDTMSLFNSTRALGVTPEQIRTPVATYGIPEMGTRFVRQMLQETQPSTFADLLQISGLSHGTGVWLGNAQELIKKGICTIKTVIGCRDDIMLYLIYKAGLDAGLAFKITESVRKGKGLTDEWIEEMRQHNVPQWYIDSCLKIEYMFPKAHASAYVISAVRTAYYKLYHPIEFYAAYFSVRAADFDVEVFGQGYESIRRTLIEIEEKGFQAQPKEKAMISILEMGLEMTARGFSFKGIDLYRSHASRFIVDGTSLIPPFSAIQGVGENAAKSIAASREEGDYLSIEDFQTRSKATKTIVEILNGMGCFRGLPESNQLSLF